MNEVAQHLHTGGRSKGPWPMAILSSPLSLIGVAVGLYVLQWVSVGGCALRLYYDLSLNQYSVNSSC
jgi:hypothetical protein